MIETKNVILRDANAADRQAAIELTIAAYAQYAHYMPPEGWDMYRENIVATLEARGAGEHIVAVQSDALVGSAVLIFPETQNTTDVPEMRLLAVAPAARGQGLGHLLTNECIRRVRAAGFPSITLHTHEIMRVAMQMYERMGFVRAPELDFSPPGGSAVKGYRLIF